MKIIKYSVIFSLFFVTISYAQEVYTGNVGINTDDPKNNLDIRGDLKLTPDDSDGNNITPLSRLSNGQAGEHKIVSKGSIGSENLKDRAFYEFNLIVKLKDEAQTNTTLDTNIDANRYNLIMVNSELQDQEGFPVAITHIDTSLTGKNNYINQNTVKQVGIEKSSKNTWVIKADYPYTHAITKDGKGKTQWYFVLLAVPTSTSLAVDPNPNYTPVKPSLGGRRYYPNGDKDNPQNPPANTPDKEKSIRGDSFKVNSNMEGGVQVNPLKNYTY